MWYAEGLAKRHNDVDRTFYDAIKLTCKGIAMDKDEILKVISGLQKKHGDDFSLRLRYLTNSGKRRKRAGEFIRLTDGGELILKNAGKGGEGRYLLERIEEISKQG